MEFIAVLVTGVFMFTPGILLSFALLKGIKLGMWEKTILGVILGIITVPELSFLEFLFLGLKFNALLVMINAVALSAIAVFALWKQKQSLEFWKAAVAATPETAKAWKSWLRENWPALVVVAVMLFGFYARFATSWATNFFEFDPIYFDKMTQHLVQNGFIETFTQESYYPMQAFQRYSPMIHYLSGAWYLLYQSVAGGAFSKDALMLTGQLYPPFVGALLSFLAFLIVKEEYNKYVAVIPALLFAFTPQLIKKLAAGVNEQQPWGIFAALLLFTLFALAVSKKSRRLGLFAAVAAFAAVLGSQQYIWPVIVLAAFIGIQSLLDFLKNELDEQLIVINGVVVASAVVSNFLLGYYQMGYSTYYNASMLLLAAFAFSAALYALTKFMKLGSFKQRVGWLAGVLVVIGLVIAVTPLSSTILGYLSSTSNIRIAVAGCGVGKTIQEEGATSSALFESSYGVLNPPLLLLLAAILSGVAAILALLHKKKRDYAIAGAVIIFALIVFNAQIDGFLSWFATGIGSQDLSNAIQFFSDNDVFLYMLIALGSTAITYLVTESSKANKSALLFVLIFFPIAYVGLNKLKYMLHLAFALALVVGYILGEALRIVEESNDWLHYAKNKDSLKLYAIGGVLAVGLLVSGLQAQTVGQSMAELGSTRIPADWTQAYDWMRVNLPQDARIMSWWDYGHWTTYFGERATVLDPTNTYANFDQGVAQAFVNGEPQDLYNLMKYHKATHVLVDSDLISKWGALVFLSCSCQADLFAGTSGYPSVCPQKPETDPCTNPGASKCEAQHYDEYLDVIGECPPSITPVALPALGSSFGATYCAGQNELFLATRDGLDPTYKRAYTIFGGNNTDVNNLDPNVSYLIGLSQGKFINTNPYLPSLQNKVFYSAYTRLFFFESYPGFKLVYRSPNGMVKIFEYTGEPPESEWSKYQVPAEITTPTPTPSATPSAIPSATPSPSVEQNASNATNQTNSS